MQPRFLRHAEPWIRRSERDLLAAQQTLDSPQPLYDAAVFHAQQAAEKAFKGFLTAHGVPFSRTHLLEMLIPACVVVDPLFANYAGKAQSLSPYATHYRYPGGPLDAGGGGASSG